MRSWLVVDSGRDPGFSVFRNSELGRPIDCSDYRTRISNRADLAWAFELTPEGLKRTEAADASRRNASRSTVVDLCCHR